MSFTVRLLIFLILNFGALWLGGLSTGKAVTGEWYLQLNKAPWTPPGFVFGLSWSLIMICLSILMAKWSMSVSGNELTRVLIIYVVQWILNVAWNPVFFSFHQVMAAQIIIFVLLLLVIYMFMLSRPQVGNWALLLLPYIIWLTIANSLNLYVLVKN